MSDKYNEQVLSALLSIQRDVAEIKSMLSRGSASASNGKAGGDVASDRDLDSEHGDPSITKDPPRWSGQSYVGYRFSETSPEYLDCLASFKDWQADMDEKNNKVDGKGRPTAPYRRKDAARARGWAARLKRNGPVPRSGGPSGARIVPSDHHDGMDDLPFASCDPSHDLKRYGL